ncbi:MAG TPA: hypothetical protein VFT95_20195 [Micromonosporaceae bacterium]|nr:hypothetical protein [Micromonosporaceae bacterium]
MAGDAPAWDRWCREVFGDPYLVWHDGPDFAVLLERARADLDGVGRLLAAGLAARDPIAAQSLGRLAAAGLLPDGAAGLLRAAATTATDTFLIRVAEALHAVTADPSWAGPIVGVLASATSGFVRLDAAIALAGFPATRRLVEAAAGAVRDPEYLVRYHAANTLLRYAGAAGDISDDRALFARIATPAEGAPGDADRRSWRDAADELAARALAGGPA